MCNEEREIRPGPPLRGLKLLMGTALVCAACCEMLHHVQALSDSSTCTQTANATAFPVEGCIANLHDSTGRPD